MKSSVLEIVEQNLYATLATVCEEGTPWNTPVFCAFTTDFHCYWASHPEAVHSQNIRRNNRTFIVVYNSKAGEGEGQGVYMVAHAAEVTDTQEVTQALKLLGERRGKPFRFIEKFLPGGPQRIYKAVPTKVWLNDADKDEDGDFIKDYRLEVAL